MLALSGAKPKRDFEKAIKEKEIGPSESSMLWLAGTRDDEPIGPAATPVGEAAVRSAPGRDERKPRL
jgi:hypothetical protein